jgi:hypothetical protein
MRKLKERTSCQKIDWRREMNLSEVVIRHSEAYEQAEIIIGYVGMGIVGLFVLALVIYLIITAIRGY